MTHYVYSHTRLDNNEIFYIGIGSKFGEYRSLHREYSRAYSIDGRNRYWLEIVSEVDYKIEIVAEFDNIEECRAKELELICFYKSRMYGGTLVNIMHSDTDYCKTLKKQIKLRLNSK